MKISKSQDFNLRYILGFVRPHHGKLFNYIFAGRWIFGIAECDASVLATIWFCCASIFSLCGVTWDRYIAVTSPLRYTSRMTNNRVICVIVTIWVLSLGFGIFKLVWDQNSTW